MQFEYTMKFDFDGKVMAYICIADSKEHCLSKAMSDSLLGPFVFYYLEEIGYDFSDALPVDRFLWSCESIKEIK